VSFSSRKHIISHKSVVRQLLIKGGDNISPGYYKNPEQTRKEFFHKNDKWWFKTGDIAELHDDGAIKIIGKSFYYQLAFHTQV